MRILFFLAVLGCGTNLVASDFVTWNQGTLVTSEGEVRNGELAFQVSEMVLFKVNDEVTVFPAHKVHSFRYYDAKENINRKFVSKANSFGRLSAFYEVVLWGEVSVMRKLSRKFISNRKNSDSDDYDYFICFHNDLVPLRQFRNKVYPSLVSHSDQMRAMVNEHHLNPNQKADAIQIVQLYNKTTYTTLVAGI